MRRVGSALLIAVHPAGVVSRDERWLSIFRWFVFRLLTFLSLRLGNGVKMTGA
jgi:hypothetical protein